MNPIGVLLYRTKTANIHNIRITLKYNLKITIYEVKVCGEMFQTKGYTFKASIINTVQYYNQTIKFLTINKVKCPSTRRRREFLRVNIKLYEIRLL